MPNPTPPRQGAAAEPDLTVREWRADAGTGWVMPAGEPYDANDVVHYPHFRDEHNALVRAYLARDAEAKRLTEELHKAEASVDETVIPKLRAFLADGSGRLSDDLRDMLSIVVGSLIGHDLRERAAKSDRDAAQDAFDQAYYLVVGAPPVWTKSFDHQAALSQIATLTADATQTHALKDHPDDWETWSPAVRHSMYLFQYGLAARYAAQAAQVGPLREALRGMVIAFNSVGGMYCRQCEQVWSINEPECHAPSCLAAPAEGSAG